MPAGSAGSPDPVLSRPHPVWLAGGPPAQDPASATGSKDVVASLVSEDGATLYAQAILRNVTGGWTRYRAELLSAGTTNSARLAVRATMYP